MANWLYELPGVDLFISTNRLQRWRSRPLRPAVTDWALDSGGFTEIKDHGHFRVSPRRYAARVRRYADEVGRMQWAAPQDWMCEPVMLARTGLTVAEHQRRSVRSVLDLRTIAPDLPFIPVLQGHEPDDYLRHVDMYAAAGFDLGAEPLVGLGSVCRRQATGEAEHIVMRLQPLRLHGFGIKTGGLHRYGGLLVSADSMAWSAGGRNRPDTDCPKGSCANCLHRALTWRDNVLHPHRPAVFGAVPEATS